MTVQELLSTAEELLEISIENVEEHESKTPRVIYLLGFYGAKLWKESVARKRLHSREESRATEKWSGTKGSNDKPLTAKTIDAKVDLEPEVQRSWNSYIEVEMQRRQVESMLDAMQRKSSYIPGLQGRLNALRMNLANGRGKE